MALRTAGIALALIQVLALLDHRSRETPGFQVLLLTSQEEEGEELSPAMEAMNRIALMRTGVGLRDTIQDRD